jgi:serine/threonine protein kinase
MRRTVSGTPLYYSPELVLQSEYDEKIDVWSVGLMAYECLLGRIPFKIYSEFDLNRIVSDDVTFPEYVDLTHDAKDFILRAL